MFLTHFNHFVAHRHIKQANVTFLQREPELVRHAGYIADRIGVEHLALGSDFDGATMPQDMKDAAGLPKLMNALQTSGFDQADLRKISHENWLRVLRQTLK